MARLSMNFAPGVSRSRFTELLLLVGVAGCLFALWQREALLEQIEAKRQALSRVERTQAQQEIRLTASRREDPKSLTEARELVAALQRPWGVMLDAVQAAAKPDLQITRLQPDASTHRLLVSGQADSSEAFLGFVERLRRAPQWALVEPLSLEWRTDAATAGARALSFQLALEWKIR